MVVVKFDVRSSDPEAARAGTYEQAPPGVYKAKAVSFELTKPKNERTGKPDPKREDMWIVVYEITNPAGKYSRLYDRMVQSEASQWKTDQFLQAFDIANQTKRTGQFDSKKMVEGKPCKIRVRTQKSNPEYVEIGAVIGWDPDEEDEEDLDGETGDELEEEEIEDDEVEEEEESEEEEEEEPEGYSEADLQGMDLAGLNEVLLAYGEETPKAYKGLKAKIARILEIQPAALSGENEEEEESEEEEEESDGYDEMDDDTLRSECGDREIKVTAKTSRTMMIKKLREDDAEEPF